MNNGSINFFFWRDSKRAMTTHLIWAAKFSVFHNSQHLCFFLIRFFFKNKPEFAWSGRALSTFICQSYITLPVPVFVPALPQCMVLTSLHLHWLQVGSPCLCQLPHLNSKHTFSQVAPRVLHTPRVIAWGWRRCKKIKIKKNEYI